MFQQMQELSLLKGQIKNVAPMAHEQHPFTYASKPGVTLHSQNITSELCPQRERERDHQCALHVKIMESYLERKLEDSCVELGRRPTTSAATGLSLEPH